MRGRDVREDNESSFVLELLLFLRLLHRVCMGTEARLTEREESVVLASSCKGLTLLHADNCDSTLRSLSRVLGTGVIQANPSTMEAGTVVTPTGLIIPMIGVVTNVSRCSVLCCGLCCCSLETPMGERAKGVEINRSSSSSSLTGIRTNLRFLKGSEYDEDSEERDHDRRFRLFLLITK